MVASVIWGDRINMRFQTAHAQRGTATVELALILPVFLFLVLGLIELSVAI